MANTDRRALDLLIEASRLLHSEQRALDTARLLHPHCGTEGICEASGCPLAQAQEAHENAQRQYDKALLDYEEACTLA